MKTLEEKVERLFGIVDGSFYTDGNAPLSTKTSHLREMLMNEYQTGILDAIQLIEARAHESERSSVLYHAPNHGPSIREIAKELRKLLPYC